ncbi:MAG: hypothetical protein LUE11_07745 [Clostridia bacterium]|nr:hypothetical protein [Clostridia bacterium]
MSFDFQNADLRSYMFDGHFGLEKESLRVTQDGFLSHTGHPFPNDSNIDRDFCENQTELITEVADSVEEAWSQLAQLHTKAVRKLKYLETGREILWPFSNPPYVKGEKDILIAAFQGKLHGKEQYREYLAQKYGKKKMLFSGIHFNFSFSDELLQTGFSSSGGDNFRAYKDTIYMELAKKVTRYSWLIVYLTAASSVFDGSFFRDDAIGKTINKNYASARCSEIGYWNVFFPLLDYKNLQVYTQSIHDYIDAGQLREASELYYPVRLKPKGENSLRNLEQSGVNHLEVRTLDLNPLTSYGIELADLQFIHLLMLYLMSLDDQPFEDFEQKIAIQNVKRAAQYQEDSIQIETGWNTAMPVRDAAMQTLEAMYQFYKDTGKTELLQIIEIQRRKLTQPEGRYAVQVRKRFGQNFVQQGVALAEAYAAEILQKR